MTSVSNNDFVVIVKFYVAIKWNYYRINTTGSLKWIIQQSLMPKSGFEIYYPI